MEQGEGPLRSFSATSLLLPDGGGGTAFCVGVGVLMEKSLVVGEGVGVK